MDKLKNNTEAARTKLGLQLESAPMGVFTRRAIQQRVDELITAKDAEIEHWKGRAQSHGCNVEGGDPDCG